MKQGPRSGGTITRVTVSVEPLQDTTQQSIVISRFKRLKRMELSPTRFRNAPPPDALPGIPGPPIMHLKARRLKGPTRLATGSDSSEPSEFRSAFESIPGNREPSLFLGVDGFFTVQKRRPGWRSWFRKASLTTLCYASRNQFRGPPQSGHRNRAAIHNSTRLMVWTRMQTLHFWRQGLSPRLLLVLSCLTALRGMPVLAIKCS